MLLLAIGSGALLAFLEARQARREKRKSRKRERERKEGTRREREEVRGRNRI